VTGIILIVTGAVCMDSAYLCKKARQPEMAAIHVIAGLLNFALGAILFLI